MIVMKLLPFRSGIEFQDNRAKGSNGVGEVRCTSSWRYDGTDMSATLISLEEYLDTAYSPDCEYVDGVVVERNVGERRHSLAQRKTIVYLQTTYPDLWVWPEQRVRTVPGRRSRVPDVSVTLEDPHTDVFETPPFIVIEILSRRDEMSNVIEKLEEYAEFGVLNIWLLDPRRKRAFRYYAGRLEQIDDAFTADVPRIRLPLDEIFRGLD
jgi:Uma2 family endonuclease